MQLNDVLNKVPAHRRRSIVGRGEGSGWGKTSGRGSKGSGQRAGGGGIKLGFEGGKTPFIRRFPKIGFSNFAFRTEYAVVNVADLNKHFKSGDVGVEQLVKAGLIDKKAKLIKVLGHGELSSKLSVKAHKFSESAKQKIEKAGGSATVLEAK